MLRKSSQTIAVIDLDLSEEKFDIPHLNILFRAAHNLPICMLKKGYLDKSYVHNISEAECVDYSLSNMDVKLRNEVLGFI